MSAVLASLVALAVVASPAGASSTANDVARLAATADESPRPLGARRSGGSAPLALACIAARPSAEALAREACRIVTEIVTATTARSVLVLPPADAARCLGDPACYLELAAARDASHVVALSVSVDGAGSVFLSSLLADANRAASALWEAQGEDETVRRALAARAAIVDERPLARIEPPMTVAVAVERLAETVFVPALGRARRAAGAEISVAIHPPPTSDRARLSPARWATGASLGAVGAAVLVAGALGVGEPQRAPVCVDLGGAGPCDAGGGLRTVAGVPIVSVGTALVTAGAAVLLTPLIVDEPDGAPPWTTVAVAGAALVLGFVAPLALAP